MLKDYFIFLTFAFGIKAISHPDDETGGIEGRTHFLFYYEIFFIIIQNVFRLFKRNLPFVKRKANWHIVQCSYI